MTLDKRAIHQYLGAIHQNYMFEYFVGLDNAYLFVILFFHLFFFKKKDHELLVTGFLGKEEMIIETYEDHSHQETTYFLFTHWNFHCEYHGPYVISCRITTDLNKRIDLDHDKDNIHVTFTYTVDWEQTDVHVNDRLTYHVRKLIRSQPLDVHWLSILNSFILVILVTAFVALVFTRILRQDCLRYHASIAQDDVEDVDDPGWKRLQRDVFRTPNRIMLFSACVGTGTQLLVLMISLLILSLIGLFYPGNRGALVTAVIFCYCLTASIGGHVSGTLYIQMGGQKWATNAVLTACIFPIPFFAIFVVVNSIAWAYNSAMALPFLYILAIFVLWSVVTFPLTVYAAHRVKNIPAQLNVPIAAVSKVERQIPELPWYRNSWLQIALSGILPFTAIYIELHFLFTAIFGHQVYTLFGILCLAFSMLLIVTAAVTIGLTYFQLQSEDWRWWWRSFATAGSPGIYILGYAVFYYYYRSYMNGVLQAAFFFGYVGAVSYAFFLMLGAVGWWSTFLFLKQIYGAIKPE
ncbi:hypothetical protein RFI_21749 [Reticulomyxa filosa]|uniref:Transmembrane 9 superfamily member n=1 Tax=Reticulomyxa filosa TaxID=46433 RepID=X6MPL4_RETFI|nr:hypothetical protein RFI_21749 [Reticulomyxa filosa]|eukprot:ETO15621.1 hypothetical protein RFI_21749 [Reticulomyxa filosa]